MKIHRESIILAILIILAGCVKPAPTVSPISPLVTPTPQMFSPAMKTLLQTQENLLTNGGFESGHYEPKGEMGIVLPTAWKAWALDEKGVLRIYEPSGMRVLGQYRQWQYGVRPGQDSYVLKPEILHITKVEPYLDPLRIYDGNGALTGFKLFGHTVFGVQQAFPTMPGHTYLFAGYGHAWSRMSEDPNDAHYSHGVGTGAFYAREDSPLVNDNNDNFRFRLCADPFGSENVFSSAVQCGQGSIIYNVFHAIEPFTFTARADSSTAFLFIDSRFGYINSNAYADSLSVVDITAPPTETPTPTLTPTATPTNTPTPTVKPTYTPGPSPTPVPITWTLPCVLTLTQRVYVLLPPNSSLEWWQAALPIVSQNGWSLGTSAVDSCINSCGGRVTLAVNAEKWGCNLAKACVPNCGNSNYIPLSAKTPEDLALALERYPAWLHEAKAFGICLPLVTK